MTTHMDKILTVKVESSTYAIGISWVREILTIDKVSAVPSRLPHIRGMLTVRGNPIPLIDLRKYFEKQTLLEERMKIVEILNLRQQDHIDWLEELTSCVIEKREFKKAIDPSKCAFGKWFASYVPDTPEIKRELSAFETPHSEIHAIATEVLNLVAEGNTNKAKARLVEAKEFELKRVLSVFDQVKDFLITSVRETAIIVGRDNSYCGLIVDSVDDIRGRNSYKSENFGITGVKKGISHSITDDHEPVHILNIPEIMQDANMQSNSEALKNQVASQM